MNGPLKKKMKSGYILNFAHNNQMIDIMSDFWSEKNCLTQWVYMFEFTEQYQEY